MTGYNRLLKFVICQSDLLRRLKDDLSGATAVEYGLLIGLMALGLAGGVGALADLVNFIFELIGTRTQEVTDTVNAG